MKVLLDLEFNNFKLETERVIIYNKKDDWYFIRDISQRVDDVDKMPHYIKNDYYQYRSQILTSKILKEILKNYQTKYNLKDDGLGHRLEIDQRFFEEEELEKIKMLERELKLKEIL